MKKKTENKRVPLLRTGPSRRFGLSRDCQCERMSVCNRSSRTRGENEGEKKEREKSERGHHGDGARGAHHRFFSYVRRVVRVTGVTWNAVLAPHPTSLSYTKAGPPLVVAPSVVEHVSTTHPSILGSDLMRHWIGFSPVFHLLQRCTLQPFVNISCNHK